MFQRARTHCQSRGKARPSKFSFLLEISVFRGAVLAPFFLGAGGELLLECFVFRGDLLLRAMDLLR